jgi:hypothetical protein
MRRAREYLFRSMDFFAVSGSVVREMQGAIDALDEAKFLAASEDDLVKFFVSKAELHVPTLKRDDAELDQREGEVQVYNAFESTFFDVPGMIFELEVPFEGEAALFGVSPTSRTTVLPTSTVGDGVLTVVATEPNAGNKPVKQAFNEELDLIDQYLTWLRGDVAKLNEALPSAARTRIQQRRDKLMATKGIIADLGFKLKRRPDAPKTYAVPVSRRQVRTRPPQPTLPAPAPPEPVLDDTEYRNILDIMGNMALVMERSPRAFATIGEEDLRVHFLVQLNGQYEGQATGETFNFGGKTDILIREGGGNVFIAECKYWHGSKGYGETIDQILSYLTWRDTKAAIVLFNRNKGFSAVLDQIRSATTAHPLYGAGPVQESETRLRYVFRQKADSTREVTLTVLAFDVPNSTQA